MTPQEKAKELILKYNLIVLDTALGGSNKRVKQCALIAVDEMIRITAKYIDIHDPYYQELNENQTQIYWKEVKQEIEKL